MFLDKKCTISSIWFVMVDWSEIEQETIIYNNIDCNFEWTSSKWNQLNNDNLSVLTETDKYMVVLPIDRDQVRTWQTIELIENIIWSIGKFRIDDVLVNQSIWWWIDNLLLRCSKL